MARVSRFLESTWEGLVLTTQIIWIGLIWILKKLAGVAVVVLGVLLIVSAATNRSCGFLVLGFVLFVLGLCIISRTVRRLLSDLGSRTIG